MFKEFKEFALTGNVLDMAIGIVIGGVFTPIVSSLVDDLILPLVSLPLGQADFSDLFLVLREGASAGPYATLDAARTAGAVTLNFGSFLNTVLTFLMVAFSVFMMVRTINRWRRDADEAPTTRDCPYCCTTVPVEASRCAACTAELPAA